MPDEIIRLAHHYMKNPLRIFVDSDEIAVESVSQKYTWAEENEKFPALCSLIEAEKITRGLIFCSTKIRAGRLAQALRVEGYNAVAIHGDLSQGQRDRAMQAFRGGSVAVLVATDVAARGLDITNVSQDRKSTRLNSSHVKISYAVFCLKKKKKKTKSTILSIKNT